MVVFQVSGCKLQVTGLKRGVRHVSDTLLQVSGCKLQVTGLTASTSEAKDLYLSVDRQSI